MRHPQVQDCGLHILRIENKTKESGDWPPGIPVHAGREEMRSCRKNIRFVSLLTDAIFVLKWSKVRNATNKYTVQWHSPASQHQCNYCHSPTGFLWQPCFLLQHFGLMLIRKLILLLLVWRRQRKSLHVPIKMKQLDCLREQLVKVFLLLSDQSLCRSL